MSAVCRHVTTDLAFVDQHVVTVFQLDIADPPSVGDSIDIRSAGHIPADRHRDRACSHRTQVDIAVDRAVGFVGQLVTLVAKGTSPSNVPLLVITALLVSVLTMEYSPPEMVPELLIVVVSALPPMTMPVTAPEIVPELVNYTYAFCLDRNKLIRRDRT